MIIDRVAIYQSVSHFNFWLLLRVALSICNMYIHILYPSAWECQSSHWALQQNDKLVITG